MLWPSRRSSRAVTKPEAPAPITATWRDKIGWGACRDMEEILATGHRVNTVPAETETRLFRTALHTGAYRVVPAIPGKKSDLGRKKNTGQ